MKTSNALRFLPLAATLLCASAVAQTRFCMGGDLDHMSQTQRTACSAKLQAVKNAAAEFHAPDGWHFVVVCGENGWKEYAAYVAEEDPAILAASADTHLEQHETFLREDRLNLADQQSLRRVVAREVAGILLQSQDETAINHQVNLWISQDQGRSGI